MKKLTIILTIAVMLVSAVGAYALNDDWLIYLRAGDRQPANPDYSKALSNCAFGTKSGYTNDAPGAEDKSQASGSTAYTTPAIGCFDMGTGANGTGYCWDQRAAIEAGGQQVWNIKLWALSNYQAQDIVLSAWNPIAHDVNGDLAIKLKVVHDPTGTYQDGTLLVSSWDADKNGSQVAPAYTRTFTGAGSLKDSSSPITLQLIAAYSPLPAAPEPGTMAAMLSGLAGLVGFAIRRRK